MIVRRILFINVILLFATMVLSYKLYSDWQDYESSRPLERIVARASGQTGPGSLPEYKAPGNQRLQSDFYSIAGNDLFHPDRRPPEAEGEEGPSKADAPKFPKEPEMQGVIESQGEKKALLTIFGERNDSVGESRIVSLNDTVQGWTVSEITDTTTTLTWNEQSEVIDIFNSSAPSQGARKPAPGNKNALNIIKIGSRQAAVDITSPDASTPGEVSLGTASSPASSRSGASVGAGRFSARPAALPNGRPESKPE